MYKNKDKKARDNRNSHNNNNINITSNINQHRQQQFILHRKCSKQTSKSNTKWANIHKKQSTWKHIILHKHK